MYMWFSLPIVLQVERVVDGFGSNNLTKVIMATLMKCGALIREEVVKKLLCFCADGTLFFRGETCVTKQIKDVWAPFSMGVHCVAH